MKRWQIVILCVVLFLLAVFGVFTCQYLYYQKVDNIQELGPGDYPEPDPNIAYV